jgi:FlaA1/EpsC-like NDP-sugar epimerase
MLADEGQSRAPRQHGATPSDRRTRMGRPTTSDHWWAAVASRSLRGPADLSLAVLDAALVAAAFTIMLVLRYDLSVPDEAWQSLPTFLLVAVLTQLVANRLAGLYGPVWQHASIVEAKRIVVSGTGNCALLFGWQLVGPRLVPLSVVLSGALFATALLGAMRFQSRLFAFKRGNGRRDDATRVLIVGAGHSAGSLLREIERSSDGELVAVALVDDDPRKVGRSIGTVPIAGTIDDLVQVGSDHRADLVILAIPSAGSPLVRRVADAVGQLQLPLKVLPSVAELMNGEPQLHDVRDLSIVDLLGRQPVATDLESVASMIVGRRVLVTGGGGSIGSEIVRQVAAYAPATLLVLDRDETNLFDAMASIGDRGTPVLLDIRDEGRLRRLFVRERPEIVFHAAANKHVPLLESHPAEAAATNVLGTRNLVRAARDFGVAHFVFVSTDKAVEPASVMGASKRLGEQLVLAHAPEDTSWCAVRFGNVLGSRGSVVPTFMRQIREGGPVTLTHPDMTRFFMSIPEAVQLVLQAAALADDRQIFMLDMGAPVRIADLAQRMISLAGLRVGVDIELQITGLRPGEKITEELYTLDECPSDTGHPKVFQLRPRIQALDELQVLTGRLSRCLEDHDDDGLRQLLLGGVPAPVTVSPRGVHGHQRPGGRRTSRTAATVADQPAAAIRS